MAKPGGPDKGKGLREAGLGHAPRYLATTVFGKPLQKVNKNQET
jgi:hypothetical protein